MYFNENYPSGIVFLSPRGTNSTMFTQCCGTAICEDEKLCPSCGRKVIGHDAESNHERAMIRWRFATSLWPKRKEKK